MRVLTRRQGSGANAAVVTHLADDQVGKGHTNVGCVDCADLEQAGHAVLKDESGQCKFEQLPAKKMNFNAGTLPGGKMAGKHDDRAKRCEVGTCFWPALARH